MTRASILANEKGEEVFSVSPGEVVLHPRKSHLGNESENDFGHYCCDLAPNSIKKPLKMTVQ